MNAAVNAWSAVWMLAAVVAALVGPLLLARVLLAWHDRPRPAPHAAPGLPQQPHRPHRPARPQQR